VLVASRLCVPLRPQLALQAADRARRSLSALVRDEVRGAAIGAAEEALGGRTAKTPLSVTAPTEISGGVWCALEHSVSFRLAALPRGCALAGQVFGEPLDASRWGAAVHLGSRSREHTGTPVLDRARVGDARQV
jgi:hypothetical protein